MKKLCIIIVLLASLAARPASDTAHAWMRHWHDDYGPYDDYHRHYRHFGYPPYGYIHRYYPEYADRYTEKDAWELVENNRPQKALEIFEKLAGTAPSAGRLKLGAAVAAADTGQLSKSVRLMRQVLQYNPGALQLFEPEAWLTDRLQLLTQKFQELQEPDAGFMLASLYYLLKDQAACLEAVRMGKASGDTSDSALNLFYMAEKDTWRFQQGKTAPSSKP